MATKRCGAKINPNHQKIPPETMLKKKMDTKRVNLGMRVIDNKKMMPCTSQKPILILLVFCLVFVNNTRTFPVRDYSFKKFIILIKIRPS